jgi:hypothetical protein
MRKTVILAIFTLLFVGFYSQVNAQTATPTRSLDSNKEFMRGLSQPKKLAPSGFNQKLCEAHVKVARLRENNLAKRATNMQKRLDKIATIVENYYTTKLVPQNKTISNYDALLSDVNAKKAALTPLIIKVQSDSQALTCENGAARSQFETFRTDATSLIAAFKAYRISLINLIQAVRKANGNPSPSISPTETVTPEVLE